MYKKTSLITNCAFRPYNVGTFINRLLWPDGFLLLANPGRRSFLTCPGLKSMSLSGSLSSPHYAHFFWVGTRNDDFDGNISGWFGGEAAKPTIPNGTKKPVIANEVKQSQKSHNYFVKTSVQ